MGRLKSALADRYAIEHELGAGGMATVYLAHDIKHDRKVAVKVLRPELAAVLGAERFLAEIKTTANLQHPHILPLHDSGEVEGTVFYVMPFVEGESLRDRLNREKQLPVGDAVRIATEVAGALDYAHRKGIIHRDIKPENILLHDGQALVADFGIALAAANTGGARMTETGMSLGTPHYMSPEQAMGERDLDARTDVYALGCVMYEMLTGEPPFDGPTAQAIVAKVMASEPVPVATLRRTVPPAVAATVHTALQKLPADRFASAADMRAALANPNFEARPEIEAGPRAVRSWALAAAALVVGLLLGILLRSGTGKTSTGTLAAHLQVNLPPGVSLPLDSDYPVLAVSPDGSRLVFVGEEDGRRQLYTRLLTDSESRPIGGTEGAVAPFFSPDGEWIAYLSGSMLFKVAAAGGAPVPIHGANGVGVSRGAAWVSETTLVIVGSANAGLATGTISEGRVGGIAEWDSLTTASMPAAWPTLVSGQTDVVFARSPAGDADDTQIAVFSLESGAARSLINRAISPRYSPTGHLLFARGSVLHAIEYDPARGETTGSEQEVKSDVAAGSLGVSHYAVGGGGVLAYVAGKAMSSEFELVWVDRNGEVVGTAHQGRRYSDPRLSPDGGRVALTVTEGPSLDVWMLDLERNTLEPQTRHPGEDFNALWSPDGSSLAISSEIGEDRGEPGPALAWIPELGGAMEQLVFTPEKGALEFPTSWSHDGRSIVVTTHRQGRSADIALFSLDGERKLIPLVETAAAERGARVSPDGAWLAYVSNASGRDEILIQPFPGPGTASQVSTDGGFEPVWSRDSRELFYRSGLDVMVVDVAPGPELFLSRPQRLFTGRFERALVGGGGANFDVSLDGRRFLMVKRKETVQPTVIHVVLNWPSVLLSSDGR